MAKKINQIGNILPREKAIQDYTPFKDLLDQMVVIQSYKSKMGNKGPYVIMTCNLFDTGEEVFISTGASAVLDQLAECQRQSAFPVQATLRKVGDAYVLE